MHFKDLNLSSHLLETLEQIGYSTPTPIQHQSIPPILDGRDIFGCAQTGTGKTAAFALPLLQLLEPQELVKGKRKIRALVLAPTRELAIQIHENFKDYGKKSKLRTCVIFGGVSQHKQVNQLRAGVDILIATTGRLLDLSGQGHVSIANVEYFVLDEADRMLDMGFIHDIKRILPKLPKQKQSIFFSATVTPDIKKLAGTILKDPINVQVTPVSSTVDIIDQSVYYAEKTEKVELLLQVVKSYKIEQAIVFSRTKHGADRISRNLNKVGVKAEAIHGNKSQNNRQRVLEEFRNGQITILVATDIAARGIDIENLSHVINYDLPEVAETYVHRIGRTGRAGASGIAISFCSLDEKTYLKNIIKMIKKDIPEGKTLISAK